MKINKIVLFICVTASLYSLNAFADFGNVYDPADTTPPNTPNQMTVPNPGTTDNGMPPPGSSLQAKKPGSSPMSGYQPEKPALPSQQPMVPPGVPSSQSMIPNVPVLP